MSYTNADGLFVLTFDDKGKRQDNGVTAGSIKQSIIHTIEDASTIGSTFGSSDIDVMDATIPAGAYITNAYVISTADFTSGGAATLDIGLYEADGTAIDADGIDAAVALAALSAGNAVNADGALVGGTLAVANEAYVGLKYNTATYTAGTAKVVVEYIEV